MQDSEAYLVCWVTVRAGSRYQICLFFKSLQEELNLVTDSRSLRIDWLDLQYSFVDIESGAAGIQSEVAQQNQATTDTILEAPFSGWAFTLYHFCWLTFHNLHPLESGQFDP